MGKRKACNIVCVMSHARVGYNASPDSIARSAS